MESGKSWLDAESRLKQRESMQRNFDHFARLGGFGGVSRESADAYSESRKLKTDSGVSPEKNEFAGREVVYVPTGERVKVPE